MSPHFTPEGEKKKRNRVLSQNNPLCRVYSKGSQRKTRQHSSTGREETNRAKVYLLVGLVFGDERRGPRGGRGTIVG